MNSNIKLLLAAIIGFAFFYGLFFFWAYFANWNPFFKYLISCCASEPWFKSALFIQDLLINSLLCLIPAYLILKLNHKNLFLILCFAVIPSFILNNYHLLLSDFWGAQYFMFLSGWFVELMLLPLIAVVLSMVKINGT